MKYSNLYWYKTNIESGRLLLLLLIPIFLLGKTVIPQNSYRSFQIKMHNINQIEMCISNFGKFGQSTDLSYGLWWPKGTNHNYIWGAGTWFGAVDTVDTMVTVGYNFWNAASEYVPGLVNMSYSDPKAIIYIYSENWPPPAVNYPMAPKVSKSQQDSWCAYNDLNPNFHEPNDTKPIGLEVYQTVYAWNTPLLQNVIFLKYEFKNVSGHPLTGCYFGVHADCDIGKEYGTPGANDRTAGILNRLYLVQSESLLVDDLCYQWQEDSEPGWSEFPGVIGFDLLQTAFDLVEGEDKDVDGILDQYERDSVYYLNNLPPAMWDVDGDGLSDWRDPSEIPQLGMTAFKLPTLTHPPDKDSKRYLTLAGYNFITGEYEPWDTAPSPPEDQRFVQCSGPFDLASDSSVVFIFAIMLADWHNIYGSPDTAIAWIDNIVQATFDMNYLMPIPPSPPKLTVIPGDAQLTLLWDNTSEIEPDPFYEYAGKPGTPFYNPFYKQYDFEGYLVWKSITGKKDDFQLLNRCDLFNGIIFEDTIQPESIRIKASDTGILHHFIDTEVRNGFTYYYAVSAFDYNFAFDVMGNDTIITPVWTEGGKSVISTEPRRDPVNYTPGTFNFEIIKGNPLLQANLEVGISYPSKMNSDSLFVEFGTIKRNPTTSYPEYCAFLLDKNKTQLDSCKVVLPLDTSGYIVYYEFREYNGLSIKPLFIKTQTKGAVSIFDTIIRQSGTYPDSLLSVPARYINWAYRGNDFEIRWYAKNSGGPVNTISVRDLATGEIIPYKPYLENINTDSLGDGWCFRSMNQSSDTLIYGNAQTGTRSIYICSGKIGIARGWLDAEPRPSDNDVWIAKASTNLHPAPFGATIAIIPTPAKWRTDTTFKLNVKVVPNPYIVHNEWEYQPRSKRLKFINLPNQCIIRIFNLNGEILKTIIHNDTGGDEWWDLLSEKKLLIASGVYIFHIESKVGTQVGKFVIVR